MDTKGFIAEHSKAKLELYSRYLRNYLTVLLTTPSFDSIAIHDIFAGRGVSANAEKGSAIIAAEVINEIGKNRNLRHKPISLNLNDAESKSIEELKTHLKGCTFVEFSNLSADTYIGSLVSQPGQHRLFFIDPHGYTQISANNLKKLFSQPRSDFLVFVPIYHIYRFLRHDEQSEQLRPIATFLSGLGVDESSAKDTESVDDFSELVKATIGRFSDKKWVTKQVLRNKVHNSTYCLFFLTDHILGAEKFLEARHATTRQESSDSQKWFDFIEIAEKEREYRPFKGALQPGGTYDNVQLYEVGIRHDLRPTEANDALRALEDSGRITVTAVGGKPRRGRRFYIGYSYYKKPERRIVIRVQEAP